MHRKIGLFFLMLLFGFPPSPKALTVEEILALKKVGVSDETIQMLLEQEHLGRAPADYLGTWTTPDGRLFRSTGKRPRPASPPIESSPPSIYPFVDLTPPEGNLEP